MKINKYVHKSYYEESKLIEKSCLVIEQENKIQNKTFYTFNNQKYKENKQVVFQLDKVHHTLVLQINHSQYLQVCFVGHFLGLGWVYLI